MLGRELSSLVGCHLDSGDAPVNCSDESAIGSLFGSKDGGILLDAKATEKTMAPVSRQVRIAIEMALLMLMLHSSIAWSEACPLPQENHTARWPLARMAESSMAHRSPSRMSPQASSCAASPLQSSARAQ